MVHPSLTNRNDPDWREDLELYEYGYEAMNEGRIPEAIELFQKSVLLSPHYKPLLLLGDCLVKENRLNEAVVAYAAVTTLNRSGIAPAHLAEVWFELGDHDRAKDMIELALQRQPHYKRAQAFRLKIEEAIAQSRQDDSDTFDEE
jgi:tetratricopeptide (TPR) repeat protein